MNHGSRSDRHIRLALWFLAGPLLPPGLPIKSQLQYYASQFQTAELNGVFYRTPTLEAVRSWKEQTGKDFVFTWKASKFITHWKRLFAKSVNSIELMEDRLSCWVMRSARSFFNCHRTFKPMQTAFPISSACFRSKRRYSFEFRHPSWYSLQIMRLLSKENISLCISDHYDAPARIHLVYDLLSPAHN